MVPIIPVPHFPVSHFQRPHTSNRLNPNGPKAQRKYNMSGVNFIKVNKKNLADRGHGVCSHGSQSQQSACIRNSNLVISDEVAILQEIIAIFLHKSPSVDHTNTRTKFSNSNNRSIATSYFKALPVIAVARQWLRSTDKV